MTIAVSIVSHGHGPMLKGLVEQLLGFEEVGQILLTINVPEDLDLNGSEKLYLIINDSPKGFGANHNAAFAQCRSEFFCVLNPDVKFIENVFPVLLSDLNDASIGVVAPRVFNDSGCIEDSCRKFPTPIRLLSRYIFSSDEFPALKDAPKIFPEWVGGMFLLFRSLEYKSIGGFDQKFFMYCEDADICARLWERGKKVLCNTKTTLIHNAHRASRKSWTHARWHCFSLFRFWWLHLGRFFVSLRPAHRSAK